MCLFGNFDIATINVKVPSKKDRNPHAQKSRSNHTTHNLSRHNAPPRHKHTSRLFALASHSHLRYTIPQTTHSQHRQTDTALKSNHILTFCTDVRYNPPLWVRDSLVVLTPLASSSRTVRSRSGPTSTSRSASSVPPTSPPPSVVLPTPRVSSSRRSVLRLSSPTPLFASVSRFSSSRTARRSLLSVRTSKPP